MYWTFKIFRLPPAGDPQPWILLDYVNLLFHEAGHYIIFAWFGQTIFVLGDTDGHDWHFLFSKWNLLPADIFIGQMVFVVGILIVAGALALMAWDISEEFGF